MCSINQRMVPKAGYEPIFYFQRVSFTDTFLLINKKEEYV